MKNFFYPSYESVESNSHKKKKKVFFLNFLEINKSTGLSTKGVVSLTNLNVAQV